MVPWGSSTLLPLIGGRLGVYGAAIAVTKVGLRGIVRSGLRLSLEHGEHVQSHIRRHLG